MARKSKTCGIQHGLVDGCGDKRRRIAFHAGRHRDLNGFGDGGGIARIRLSRVGGSLGTGGNQRMAMRGEDIRVADKLERMAADHAAEMIEGGNSDLRPDAGRLAHSDEDWFPVALSG